MNFLLRLFLSSYLITCSIYSSDQQLEFLRKRVCLKKPLKILFVVHQFPKFNQPFILNQMIGLIDMGVDLFIYANNYNPYDIIPQKVQEYNLLEKTYYRSLPVEHSDYDIIYCLFGIDGYIGLELKKRFNLSGKVITCFRGDDISEYILPNKEGKSSRKRGPFRIACYDSHMYDELFRQGDFFLPVCKYFKRKLITLGCDLKNISVNHSAIDYKKYTYKQRKVGEGEKLIIMTVGRLVELKGTKYILEAFAKLRKKHTNIQLIIVGDGPSKKKLKKLTEKLNIKKNVKFFGFLAHEEIQSMLLKSHIFVLPSVTTKSGVEEGIPNALMEAMATGMPVIGSYHSGIPELIKEGESGFLVSEKNSDELAEKLEFLIKNQILWGSIGYNARRKIKKYHNIEKQNLLLINKFYEICGKA